MELEGKVWKDGKFWLVEVPAIDVCTQGRTRKEAFMMIEDAIMELMYECFQEFEIRDIKLEILDHGNDIFGVNASNNNLMSSFSLMRQRELSKSSE